MNRRNAIKTLGILTCPPILFIGNEAYANPMRMTSYFAKFAEKVATTVVSSEINAYLKTLRDQSHADQIRRTNEKMAREGGFDDTSISKVHEKNERLFYPVGQTNQTLNICVPFFNISNANLITMVEGPSIIGMAKFADDMAKRYGNSKTALASVPKRKISAAEGSFASGYTTPDEFYTDSAKLKIDYKNTSVKNRGTAGTGVVDIVAIDSSNNPFYNERINISFDNIG